MRRLVLGFILAASSLIWGASQVLAGAPPPVSSPATSPAAAACARPAAGSAIRPPPDLYSQNGVLNVTLKYATALDSAGRTLFCFKTTSGQESPTFHLWPGDTLNIAVTNDVPALPPGSPTEVVSNAGDVCGDKTMTLTSMNIHFHGVNSSPACHGDQVIHTLINSGEIFHYSINIPTNEPPGLYWYHPHVHGISEAALQGGASGAIVVEGIENLQPAVAGLPERVLILRDLTVPAATADADAPAWDVSLNYVPVPYPAYTPGIIDIKPGRPEFWRVVNASADTVTDLQVLFDGKPQPLAVVALDGVPTNSQDGTRRGQTVTMTHILLATANRAEFIMPPVPPGVKLAQLATLNVDTGPDGDNDPARALATLRPVPNPEAIPVMPQPTRQPWAQRFEGMSAAPVTAKRKLYFSEVLSDPANPASPTNFYITVDGAAPTLFDPNNAPAITTTQGSVEDWTIENRAGEVHEFHIHQTHFQLLARNGVPVPQQQSQFVDTIQVPYWSGKGPYPSVTVRMDFRGPYVGDFVYHCHILGHEDNGMMATIRVLPKR